MRGPQVRALILRKRLRLFRTSAKLRESPGSFASEGANPRCEDGPSQRMRSILRPIRARGLATEGGVVADLLCRRQWRRSANTKWMSEHPKNEDVSEQDGGFGGKGRSPFPPTGVRFAKRIEGAEPPVLRSKTGILRSKMGRFAKRIGVQEET